MQELFGPRGLQSLFDDIWTEIAYEINNFTDDKIIGSDIEEWIDYYFNTHKIMPLHIYKDNITQMMEKSKKSFDYQPINGSGSMMEGYKITFIIPFDGDGRLLFLRPNYHYVGSFHVDSVKRENDTEQGEIRISQSYRLKELENKDNPNEFIDTRFANHFKDYLDTICWINDEVAQFNNNLPKSIKSALEQRKNNAARLFAMNEKLSIPLKVNPHAPNIFPVPLKKIVRSKPQIPKVQPQEKFYEISDDDYANIQRIIYMMGTSMEKTPSTFARLSEEEIRDFLIAVLNTHYDEGVTAETFSKSGKTDIHILFDNKSAYIAECKVWHGEKGMDDALKQLFSYTTWRYSKTSLIIFNKNNKDFKSILVKLEALLKTRGVQQKSANMPNEWLYNFKKNDSENDIITVHIVIFDLYCMQKSLIVD